MSTDDFKAGIAGIVACSNFGLDLPVAGRYKILMLLREIHEDQ
jgi:hypothetical protein